MLNFDYFSFLLVECRYVEQHLRHTGATWWSIGSWHFRHITIDWKY